MEVEFNRESTSPLMQFMIRSMIKILISETHLVVIYRVSCQIAEVDKFHVQSTKLSKDAAASRCPAPVSTNTTEFQQICIKKGKKQQKIQSYCAQHNYHSQLNK